MRFSETLRFNANPDWWTYYIPYDNLKHNLASLRHLLYAADRTAPPTAVPGSSDDDDEPEPTSTSSPSRAPTFRRTASQRVLASHPTRVGYGAVLEGRHTHLAQPLQLYPSSHLTAREKFEQAEVRFFEELDTAFKTVEHFYTHLRDELEKVTEELSSESLTLKLPDDSRDDRHEQVPLLPSSDIESGPAAARLSDRRDLYHRRLVQHYKELGETINFSTLNRTGFDKILKKFDKVCRRNRREQFMNNYVEASAFVDTKQLEELKVKVETIYAGVFKSSHIDEARAELTLELRDLVIWERNTIWRDVLRTERKVQAFHTVQGGENIDLTKKVLIAVKPKVIPCLAALIVFLVVLVFPQLVHKLPIPGGRTYSTEILDAAHRCLAMSLGIIVLWAFEGLPLYVTSFLVLPAAVLLRVFIDEKSGVPLSSQKTSGVVFQHFSSSTIILIICVYSLGAALSKFELDKLLATGLLSHVRRAHHLLFSVMCLAVFVSMFVSNVAAPVLLNSVMMPTIDAMRDVPSGRQYVQCLLLGIMVSSNIGGFASPIASPQAAVALGLLGGKYDISFLKWCVVALPVCAVMNIAFYILLYVLYKPQQYVLPPVPRTSKHLSWVHWTIMGTLLTTVLLWSDHGLSAGFGSAGMVAVVPILLFFGSGILSKEDFNNLPWDVVYLVGGGLVLGAAVESCLLLELVAERLTNAIGVSNLRLAYYIFSIFMAVVANAVSHTVSAVIVLPLVYKVGETLGHPQMLVLGATFAASAAMALPVSSFPNISALRVEDETGRAYLSAGQLLKIGSLMTAQATLILLTIAYELMRALGM